VKRLSIESPLTSSIMIAAFGSQNTTMSKTNSYGLDGLRSEELPSAFDLMMKMTETETAREAEAMTAPEVGADDY
jgi:hypothetical protein